MDAFELIHPAFAGPQRVSLEDLFAVARPNAAIRSPHVRYVLFFGALPLQFLLQKERYAYRNLLELVKKQPLRQASSASDFGRAAAAPCYATAAWQIEQLFVAAERADDTAAALELNDEAAYYMSCLLSCMTSLHTLLACAARELIDCEGCEGEAVAVDVSILGDLWDLNPLWLNHQGLHLEGPQDQIEAFYRVAIMKPKGFYDAVSNAMGYGDAAPETRRRYGLGRSAFRIDSMTVEELSPGFGDRCLAEHLQRAYRELDGAALAQALRLVFIKPFAALWESGALTAVRRKAPADPIAPDSRLDDLLQTARAELAKRQPAA